LRALTDRADPDLRRLGALGLGERGTMADVPALAGALRDPDGVVRALAERALWAVWSRSGDADVDRLFQRGLAEMRHGEAETAARTFGEVIRRRPEFAEGWNKRATVYYLFGEYGKSLADCDEVMKRNAFHFGALSGYGLIYLKLDQPARALEYFERALDVNPNLDQVRETIEVLRALLLQRRKDTI
ncbi:MAG: tetratricopeptide repeat protein, partial [Candidatus Rokuibacteriota bacterium]